MAQSDQTIQNATFPTVRADINDNLQALFSQSSGPSAPAVTVAYQPWVDTSSSPAVWKIRNGTNTGWITVGSIDTNFSVGGVTAIANGGTGATTATAALTALLPTQTGNGGRYLSTDGTVTSWALAAAAGASLQVFTASGTYTPTAGKTTFLVFATGGGGGGNSGGGGGAGGTALRIYTAAEMGVSAAVTIGAGGSGGGGEQTSFDPAGTGLTIIGGGGVWTGGTTPGAGGGASNSQLAIDGQPGIGSLAGGASFWAGGRGRGGQPSSAGTGGAVLVLEF